MKVLKIGAVWCNGCVVMKPRWQQIEKENPWLETKYLDFDVDTDEIEHLNLDVEKLPTFIFLDKDGVELEKLSGEVSKKLLIEKINLYKGL